MEITMDKILTVPEVAEYLQMSESKIYYMIQRKEITYLKFGRNVRIRKGDLEQWMIERKVPAVWTLLPGSVEKQQNKKKQV